MLRLTNANATCDHPNCNVSSVAALQPTTHHEAIGVTSYSDLAPLPLGAILDQKQPCQPPNCRLPPLGSSIRMQSSRDPLLLGHSRHRHRNALLQTKRF